MKKLVFSGMLLSSYLFASGCWSTKEDSDIAFKELDGIAVFSFKDAVTCEPIVGASVKFLDHNFTTDANGYIKLPVPPSNIDVRIPLEMYKDGYIDFKQKILARVGSYWNSKFLVSKGMPIGSMRFVLAWGALPKDLDLHLVSNNYHISYRKMKNYEDKAQLDRDARNGYGAETITLNKLEDYKTYKVYVYNYSNEASFSGKANVSVYKNNKLDKVVPITTKSRCVEVATINNNRITYRVHGVDESLCKN